MHFKTDPTSLFWTQWGNWEVEVVMLHDPFEFRVYWLLVWSPQLRQYVELLHYWHPLGQLMQLMVVELK